MKLVMTLLVRDEEDILEWNLRYHLSRGVEHFVVTDNRSQDGTADILRRYEQQGVVTYLHETADDYSQDVWVTRMAKLAQEELGADWLLHTDADEFWWPEAAHDLRDVFAAVPPSRQVVAAPRLNFVAPLRQPGATFFERMVYRRRDTIGMFGDALPPKIAHRPLGEPYVHQGNHAVSDGGRAVKAEPLPGAAILHFPARTPEQLRAKVEKGGAAYARNQRFKHWVGSTWREMYRACREGDFDRVVAANFIEPGDELGPELVEDHRLRDYLDALP